MKLLCSASSPYVRKARITLREKGLQNRVDETMLVAMDSPETLIAANPLSKIPALLRDEGEALFDSPVVCEYLDSLPSGEPGLLPNRGEARWQCLRLQALSDGIIDACFNLVMENRRDEALRSGFWQDRWTSAVLRSLDRLESESGDLAGQFNLGIIALGCALGYLDLRLDRLSWRANRPKLEKTYEELMQRPSFQDTVPRDPA